MPILNTLLISIIRQFRKLTQADLADMIGVKQSQISMWETGTGIVSDDSIHSLEVALRVPRSLLMYSGPIPSSEILFRKRATSAKDEAAVKARILLLMTIIENERRDSVTIPKPISRFPQGAANEMRDILQLGNGPIQNMTKIMEDLGVILVPIKADDWFDAVLMRTANGIPVVFYGDKFPGDRLRLSLAHELGHICLQHDSNDNDIDPETKEKDAWAFASEFLVPLRMVQSELKSLSLAKAMDLRKKWKLSMSAFITMAGKNKDITYERSLAMRKAMKDNGIDISEPYAIDVENPGYVFDFFALNSPLATLFPKQLVRELVAGDIPLEVS
jgi:Zn-dependent peptidase ImmA (M78 family)/DNA-binding XRE family transcriptional regulator